MDGRHAAGDELSILQAQHYLGSPLSALMKAMKAEGLKRFYRMEGDALKSSQPSHCLASR
jgi:hypothetical protein